MSSLDFEQRVRDPRRARPFATLDGLVLALARLESLRNDLTVDAARVRDDLPALLQTWLAAKPGRHVERDDGGVTLVRCGRGMRQTSRFRTATAAAYAIAQNTVFWINEPGDTRRWRGPAKRKDRVRAG